MTKKSLRWVVNDFMNLWINFVKSIVFCKNKIQYGWNQLTFMIYGQCKLIAKSCFHLHPLAPIIYWHNFVTKTVRISHHQISISDSPLISSPPPPLLLGTKKLKLVSRLILDQNLTWESWPLLILTSGKPSQVLADLFAILRIQIFHHHHQQEERAKKKAESIFYCPPSYK